MASVNNVRKIRESKMMSKAELARKASVTVQTIDRIEKGNDCRLDTKRKIILALGYKLGERSKVFGEETSADDRASSQVKTKSKSKVKVRRQAGKGKRQA
ncbi:putative helix-turn-helix motif protein [Nitrospina gracilis 3/211]|uniref:Putative helix-turn-helix motif protein n=1 Tax=Nitrospina gracilis (strain 3/211) TaxID=1266370 RepID=M1YY68_NITG3|nr:helix-turn-helix transcriptional regulator [Nitrospina gracilis]MCF8723150.1 DNA-binding XRE family transcriptional regulator [Nitrospina sp. Nb-3]CCQ90194.1 putative helix-turn-helix motif protein [Nitrospina gracilis 3/211]